MNHSRNSRITLLPLTIILFLRIIFSVLLPFYSALLQATPDQVSIQLSAEEQTWMINHPHVSVGGLADWPPFDFVDHNGKHSGLAHDYLNLLADKTGLQFKVTIDQWSHQLQKIRDQQIDLLSTAYYTNDRAEDVFYSQAYFQTLDYFFIRDDLDVKTISDLNGKRIAIPKDYAHITILKKYFPKIKIVIVDSYDAAIDAVLENRADALYDSYAVLAYALKKDTISTIIPFKSTRVEGNRPVHFISRTDAPELASIIQKGLDTISTQEKQAIYNEQG